MSDSATTHPSASSSDAKKGKYGQLCDNCCVLTVTDGVFAGPLGLSAAERPRITGFVGLYEHPDLNDWKWYPLNFSVTDSFPDLPVLRASHLEGCPFCLRLISALCSREFARVSWAERHRSGYVHISMSIWAKGSPSDPKGVLSFLEVVARMNGNSHRIFFPIETDTGAQKFPTNGGDYLSPVTTNWMLRSLKHCEENHGHGAVGSSFCPTRLIDVRKESMKLVLREDILNSLPDGTDRPQYTALSYVWGQSTTTGPQLMTDSNTLAERCAGIREKDLPSAVRDAVLVTRALSIPYLWVDALCILQDTSENQDWEKECAMMDKIYEHAKLTICAATSRSCSDGFLRRPTWLPILQVRFMSPSFSRTPFSKYRLQSFVVATKQHLPSSIEECNMWETSWRRRGWTFQESLLSGRCLIFGWLGLVFSCPTSHQIQGGIPRADPLNFQLSQYSEPTFLSKDETARHSDLYKTWAVTILREYSPRRGEAGLSRNTDCLPALAGLAAKFSHLLGVPETDYVAGLWKQDLLRSLIWIALTSHDRGSIEFDELLHQLSVEPWLAPSWSWANRSVAYREFSFFDGPGPGTVDVLGYTLYHLVSFRSESDITAVTTPQDTSNVFGKISSGVLHATTKVAALPSMPLVREQRLLDITNISNGPKIVYLGYRYFATCVFDWDEGDGVSQWRYSHLRAPYTKVRMVLLGSAELTLQDPEDSTTKVEDQTLERQDDKDNSTRIKDIDREDLANPSQEDTRDLSPELDWEGETEDARDRNYTGDRCATGLLVVPARGKPRQYYRVGVFFSEPRGRGGLKAFQTLEDVTVEII